MRIIIIRHGQSEADLLGVHEGRADFDLTDLGIQQARQMTNWIKEHYQIDQIFSSPLKRARHTAEILAADFGIEVAIDADLMEFNNGMIDGLTREEANEKYPHVNNLPMHKAVYGMESKLEFRYRAERFLAKILYESKVNSTVAIVSYGGLIQQLYLSFLQLPLDSTVIHPTGDTGIHIWRYENDLRIIEQSNECSHLKK